MRDRPPFDIPIILPDVANFDIIIWNWCDWHYNAGDIFGNLNFFFGVIVKAPSGRLAGIPVSFSTRLLIASLAPSAEMPKDPAGRLVGIPVDSIPSWIRSLSCFSAAKAEPLTFFSALTLSTILFVFTFLSLDSSLLDPPVPKLYVSSMGHSGLGSHSKNAEMYQLTMIVNYTEYGPTDTLVKSIQKDFPLIDHDGSDEYIQQIT